MNLKKKVIIVIMYCVCRYVWKVKHVYIVKLKELN